MLVINAKGVIYDVPENLVKPHTFQEWGRKRKAAMALLNSLSKVIRAAKAPRAKASEVEGQGCCKLYPNYCPNN